MSIPAEVQNIITLAKEQELQERILDELRNDRAEKQAAIQVINTRIAEQTPIVQAARAALKAAAQAL